MPIVNFRTIRMTKVARPLQTMVASTPYAWIGTWAKLPSSRPALPPIASHREHARQDGADDAADAVHAEDVEAVVIAQQLLQARRGDVAADAGSRRR